VCGIDENVENHLVECAANAMNSRPVCMGSSLLSGFYGAGTRLPRHSAVPWITECDGRCCFQFRDVAPICARQLDRARPRCSNS
jgi:hypothetical protein